MKKTSVVLFSLLFVKTVVGRLDAGVPPGVNYQGRYVENNVPFSGQKTGCYFKIYDAVSGGNLRWGSPAETINFDKGLFNYVIQCSSHDWRTYDAYLEVTIDGTTLSPRERLQASPYAFFASSAAYAYNIPDSSVNANKLAADAVTSAKILDGAVATADVGDRQITSEKLLVTSSSTYVTGDVGTYTSGVWVDLPGMYATLDVSTQPAMIVANFSCANYHNWNNNSTYFQMLIDGTEVAATEAKRYHTSGDESHVFPVALTGMLRVTSTGSKIVKVQIKSSTDATNYGHAWNRSFNTMWFASQ